MIALSFLLVFGLTLLLAIAVSERAGRTPLSTAVLFLAVGLSLGPGTLGVVRLAAGTSEVSVFVQVALVVVLFTDGADLHVRQALHRTSLPLRALIVGLPLTGLLVGITAWLLVGLPFVDSMLLGAVLSPTDPVLAEAIVGRHDVPARLRRFLNLESGLNDGLALPFVLVTLALASDAPPHLLAIARDLAVGAGLGIAVPWITSWLLHRPIVGISDRYEPLGAPAIAAVTLGLTGLLHGNLFLAAFVSGISVRTASPALVQASHDLSRTLVEVVKLAALLAFGVLFSSSLFTGPPLAEWAFVAIALVAVRPIALSASLIGTTVDRRLFAAAAWFGPKGFSSVTFGLLALDRDPAHGEGVFHLAGLVVTASIVAHSSTDVVVAGWLRRRFGDEPAVAGDEPNGPARDGP